MAKVVGVDHVNVHVTVKKGLFCVFYCGVAWRPSRHRVKLQPFLPYTLSVGFFLDLGALRVKWQTLAEHFGLSPSTFFSPQVVIEGGEGGWNGRKRKKKQARRVYYVFLRGERKVTVPSANYRGSIHLTPPETLVSRKGVISPRRAGLWLRCLSSSLA